MVRSVLSYDTIEMSADGTYRVRGMYSLAVTAGSGALRSSYQVSGRLRT